MTKVKICGVTSLDDALAAAHAGADMIGLNFYKPSPRYIEPIAAAELTSGLREQLGDTCPTLVGVFVNADLKELNAIAEWVGLDYLQLHGDEPPELIEKLDRPVIKALRPKNWDDALAQVERYSRLLTDTQNPLTILLDAYHPDLYGGTGAQASADIAVAVKASVHRLILAGGLTPDNVAKRIAAVEPWGVDTASGVENGDPRRKDHARIQAFVHNVKSTGESHDQDE